MYLGETGGVGLADTAYASWVRLKVHGVGRPVKRHALSGCDCVSDGRLSRVSVMNLVDTRGVDLYVHHGCCLGSALSGGFAGSTFLVAS